QWANWHQLGCAYTRLGDTDQAIIAHNQAVASARQLADTVKEGLSLLYLGVANVHRQDVDRAMVYYQQALPLNRKQPIEGNNLGHLGCAYSFLGQMDIALEYLQRACTLCHDIGDRRSETFWIGQLGDVYRQSGRHEEAMALLQQALTHAHIIGDKQVK